MTKKEIVKHISTRVKLPQLQVKKVVDLTFEAIVEALVAEGKIELRNFGVFVVKTRKARLARNPLTGDEVHVDAKNVVTFQPGKLMEEQARQMPIDSRASRARKLPAAAIVGHRERDGDAKPDRPRKPR